MEIKQVFSKRILEKNDPHKKNVEIRTLDSFLQAGVIELPDMIKADVQGFELETLKVGINMKQKLFRMDL